MESVSKLIDEAGIAADMLEEMGADHTADLLRKRIAEAQRRPNDRLSTTHKLCLLTAADRYIHDTEAAKHKATSLDAQLALDTLLKQLRLARTWLDRQEAQP